MNASGIVCPRGIFILKLAIGIFGHFLKMVVSYMQMSINVVKIFGLSAFAFFIGVVLTPLLTRYLYKYKMWKKSVRTKTFSGDNAPITSELYKDKDIGTPRMGGF